MAAGDVAATAVAEEAIARIRAGDGAINAFTCVLEEEALAAADFRKAFEAVARSDGGAVA